MASIFANATITVAAASSSNSWGGLFRNHKTQAVIGPELRSSISWQQTRYHIRELSNDEFFEYQSARGYIRTGLSPLLQRA
jgi:hypothetical protein